VPAPARAPADVARAATRAELEQRWQLERLGGAAARERARRLRAARVPRAAAGAVFVLGLPEHRWRRRASSSSQRRCGRGVGRCDSVAGTVAVVPLDAQRPDGVRVRPLQACGPAGDGAAGAHTGPWATGDLPGSLRAAWVVAASAASTPSGVLGPGGKPGQKSSKGERL